MIDATPSATPMPVPPVATVTSTEAPSPPAAPPLPVFVPPPVTDPVSNLDFLPVDDAFALEMRAETIEQLVGGDALRRGVSERIEAGRSHTNANLVAGRDRVRVHGSLHEHTGHGLAEQGAHLHTTVDGTLDVHAGNEDTVLLAGHMSDLWDGGAAIVAAMTGTRASFVPTPDVPWGEGQEMQPGLPGGADRPPPSAAPESDFHAAYRKLREFRSHYYDISRADIGGDYQRVIERFRKANLRKFTKFGGNTTELAQRPLDTTVADHAYRTLQKMARQADNDGDPERAGAIRTYLDTVSEQAVEALQTLLTRHGTAEATPTPAMQWPPAAAKRRSR